MKERWYALDDAVHRLPEGVKLPDGAREIDETALFNEAGDPRFGAAIDPETGEVQVDPGIAADMAASAKAVAAAHAQKAIEAILILSGIDLAAGLLVEEAAAAGMEITELAQVVHAKGAEAREVELERRAMKTGLTK